MITLDRAVAHLRSQATTHPRSGETGEWRKDLTSRCIRMVLESMGGLAELCIEREATIAGLQAKIRELEEGRSTLPSGLPTPYVTFDPDSNVLRG